MTPLHTLRVTRERDVVVAAVSGEIDLSNAADLEGAVLAAAADARAGLVVDLTGVTFLDSAGVRFLDHVLAARLPEQRMLVAAAAGGRVRFTLRLCGFPEDLLRATVDRATAELAGSERG